MSPSTELSEAINSMFTWYRDSVVCYAFLVYLQTDEETGCSKVFGCIADPSPNGLELFLQGRQDCRLDLEHAAVGRPSGECVSIVHHPGGRYEIPSSSPGRLILVLRVSPSGPCAPPRRILLFTPCYNSWRIPWVRLVECSSFQLNADESGDIEVERGWLQNSNSAIQLAGILYCQLLASIEYTHSRKYVVKVSVCFPSWEWKNGVNL